MGENVLISVKNAIATLTLNRPAAHNSFNRRMFEDVIAAVKRCEADRDIKTVIITGAGKNFSAGGDIKEMAGFDFLSYELARLTGQMALSVRQCSKPVIAMINGVAAGAGCGLALACDFRVMTEKSVLLTAFSNVALSGDTGCIYSLYHLVGLAKTMELMAFSEPVNGGEAHRLGLATRLVPAEGLFDETVAFAEKIMARPLGALAMQKKIYYETFFKDYEKYRHLEAEQLDKAGQTADHIEAVTAFLENRKPVFNKN